VGDNPFLHSSDTPAPEPDEVKEADPEVAKAAEEGAFGALSEQSSPTSAPPPEPEQSVESAAEPEPEPQPSSSLSDQWAGGEEKTPEPAPLAATAPAETVAAAPTTSGDGSFVASFERGAGLPAGSISGRTDDALAEELGQLFNKVTQALQAMLLARAETKSAMRSSERTMISALENNPLKFSPTPEDALRIMFGQKSKSYLDAGQTIDQSFSDLQKHQMQTFGAMQSALQVLIEDLDPETIAGATAKDGGLAALVSSRRAKFWDTYVERFKAKSAHHDRGMIDAFMILFAEMYDRQS
jgi:type VI secretion system protein ImpI